MSILYVTRHGVVLVSVGLLGIFGAQAQHTSRPADGHSPLTCEVQVERSGSAVDIKAIVNASQSAAGSYRLHIVSSGGNRANIDQAGEFSVGSGSNVISAVRLGGSGSYNARLTVKADGRAAECSQRVSGSI